MARIFLDNVTKIFGKKKEKVEAVKNLTLEVPDKKLVSLLGPSGCGKTTIMRIVAGLESPTFGDVYFDDENVTDLRASERDVAMVFQFPVVYENMSVYDNIAFPLRGQRVPKHEVHRSVKEVADFLGIVPYLSNMPGGLDAGIRQRIALGRAMVRRPKVYLLDEPLTSVDPKSRVELRARLKRLQADLGQTLIYVTHDQSESMTLADKIGVMDKGELIQYDTPENIYSKPANTFVGWFVGNPGMNFLDCSYNEVDGRAILETAAFTYDVTDISSLIKDYSAGSELVLGVRPEHVMISKKKREGWIKSKCTLVEPLGNRTVFFLQVGEQTIRAKLPFTVDLSEGDDIWISFPLDQVRIFDRETNKLLS